MMIEGQYGNDYKDRKLTTHGDIVWTITLSGEGMHGMKITMPHQQNRDDEVKAWIEDVAHKYGKENITIHQVQQATVRTEFTMEDFSTINCPCDVHRNSLNTEKVIESCTAFRPQDTINGLWRCELTGFPLEGGPSPDREHYDARVIVALAKHDAEHGGTEAAVEAVEQQNIADQIDRTVKREIRYMEEEANGEREPPKEGEHFHASFHDTVCTDTYGETLLIDHARRDSIHDQGKKEDYGGRTGDWDFEDYGARYVVIIDTHEALQAYYFKNKAIAIKFFRDCPVDAFNSDMAAYWDEEAV